MDECKSQIESLGLRVPILLSQQLSLPHDVDIPAEPQAGHG
jgi:hypothetical protein